MIGETRAGPGEAGGDEDRGHHYADAEAVLWRL